ncbi:MAG: AEC family transporter [Gammaproteobacteria bacterium]|nr:AEC family transporter [Gammaproteobacteria bacterium]
MIATLNAIAPVFLIIVIGHILYRSRLVGAEVWSAIEHICFYLLFPFLIIRTLSRADLGLLPIAEFAVVLLTAVIGMAVLLFAVRALIAQYYRMSGPTFTSLFQGATRFHGFMALAIIGPLYGDTGVALAALALGVMVPVLNVLNVAVLSFYGDAAEKPTPATVLVRVAQNPLILACGAGLILNVTGLPDFAFSAVEIIGSGGLGLALLAIGAGLRLEHANANKTLVTAGVLVRLIGMPLIVLCMAWITGLDGLPRTVAIIAGAVPTASTAYVMARKMGGDAELMANIVTFQIIVAAFTLPLFIFVAEHL